MSARHIRFIEQKERRLADLRRTLATGQGLQRIPAQVVVNPYGITIREGGASPFVAGNVGVNLAQSADAFNPWRSYRGRKGVRTIIVPGEREAPETEISMPHYWALAREAREIEGLLIRNAVPGFRIYNPRDFRAGANQIARGSLWTESKGSPFGADRFRLIRPVAFEDTAGIYRAI